MTRTVGDAALVLSVISGRDRRDSTSLDVPVPDYVAAADVPAKGLRVGIPKEYFGEGLDPEVREISLRAAETLRGDGVELVDVTLPNLEYAIPTYYLIATAEASANLERYDGVRYGFRAPKADNLYDMYAKTRSLGFGAEVKRRIMLGTYCLSAGYYDAYYTQAQKVRALIARDFDQAWAKCDVLLTPTAPSAAFALGEKQDPVAMYLNDVFTIPASLAGLPAMSVPGGLDAQGLPLGLQIIGKALDEQGVLNAGLAIEDRAGFTARAGKWW